MVKFITTKPLIHPEIYVNLIFQIYNIHYKSKLNNILDQREKVLIKSDEFCKNLVNTSKKSSMILLIWIPFLPLISKFKSHPSILNIKQNCDITKKFSLKEVSVHYIKTIIINIPANKASAGGIPLQIIKYKDKNWKITSTMQFRMVNIWLSETS